MFTPPCRFLNLFPRQFCDEVIALAALSSQTSGTAAVTALSPKPLLLLHGTADEILPADCSRQLYGRAGEPKALILYAGCRHGLDQCREEVERDLGRWLAAVLGLTINPR